MEKIKENEPIQIGARIPAKLAIEFREYCKTPPHKYDQQLLFESFAKWWLSLSENVSIQENIYRGRFAEAHKQIADVVAAEGAASRTKARVSKLRQKQEKKPSKTG